LNGELVDEHGKHWLDVLFASTHSGHEAANPTQQQADRHGGWQVSEQQTNDDFEQTNDDFEIAKSAQQQADGFRGWQISGQQANEDFDLLANEHGSWHELDEQQIKLDENAFEE
ncbi:hypothetical protein ACLOJK_018117, partial [Asimina triloba]